MGWICRRNGNIITQENQTVNISNCELSNSLSNTIMDGLKCTGTGIVNVNNSDFINLTNYAINNTGTNTIDALNNYWGDPTGPYNTTNNPTGQGFEVSDNVNFTPWAEEPNTASQSEIISVYNIDSQLTEQTEHKLQLEGLSIAADGSSATIYRYSGSNLENISLNIKEDTNNETNLFGSFETGIVVNNTLEITYNHPKYFNLSNQKERDVTIQVFNDQTSDVIEEYPIKIVRPPVLMVHGLWGDVSTFKDMEEALLDADMYEQYQLKRMSYISDIPNEKNHGQFIIDKYRLIKDNRENNISLGKFDILAHSNGGLLSRQYIQKSDDYKNDVNKLITFNTPHSGSQMANFLLDVKGYPVKGNLKLFRGYDSDNGLVENLKVNSQFINKLNGFSQSEFIEKYKNIGVHSLYSTVVTHKLPGFDLLIYTYVDFIVNTGTIENEIFNNDSHDLIVAKDSQIGGCKANFFVSEQQHVGSTNNSSFQAKTMELLNQNPSDSNYFSLEGFDPPPLSSQYSSSPKAQSQKQSNETITITSPIDGTEYSAGQNVNIQVNGSSGIKNIVSSMGSSIIPIQVYVAENSSTANLTFTIPNNTIGRLEIVSAGFDENGDVTSDSKYIIVTTNAVLESIEIGQDLIYVPEGRKAIITILGHYNDGETRNITSLEDLVYSFDQNNAEIVESGLVSGLTEGEDVLTVAYSGKSTTVPITIANASEWIEIALDVDDEILAQSTLLYPNPVSDILTIHSDIPLIKVEIYSILGKKVKEINSNFKSIQTNDLSSGIYIVRMHSEKGTAVRKLIKQ